MGYSKRGKMRILVQLLLILYSFSVFAFDEEQCKVIQEKVCVDYSERVIDGLPTSQCWKYEVRFVCSSKEQNNCEIFESNRGCHEITGKCLEETPLGSCKHFEKKFICGSKFNEDAEVKHVGTDFNILKDEKDLSACSEKEKSELCEFAEEVCIEGAETRNINGKEVHKDCWKWEKQYICRQTGSASYIDECVELKSNPDCKEISKECLYENIKTKKCEHFEVKYQCSEHKTKTKDCIKQNFCIGDICKSKQRGQHNDFGSSISYINILAGMKSTEFEGCKCPGGKATCLPNEIDTRNCKFFTGNSGTCRNHHGQFNCCRVKGIIAKSMNVCKQDEKDLQQKRNAGLCHYVGGWKRKKWKVFNKKYESFCCFKSKMARIIQVEGRKQLGIDFGSKYNPDCRALTLDELKRINFTKIDFSELFNDLEHRAKSSTDAKKSDMKNKAENFKANPGQELINKKIQDFYGKGGN